MNLLQKSLDLSGLLSSHFSCHFSNKKDLVIYSSPFKGGQSTHVLLLSICIMMYLNSSSRVAFAESMIPSTLYNSTLERQWTNTRSWMIRYVPTCECDDKCWCDWMIGAAAVLQSISLQLFPNFHEDYQPPSKSTLGQKRSKRGMGLPRLNLLINWNCVWVIMKECTLEDNETKSFSMLHLLVQKCNLSLSNYACPLCFRKMLHKGRTR